MVISGYIFPPKHISIHNNVDIAYCETGSGKQTIVFIHGLAGYAPVWNDQIKALSDHFRCIAVDLPGNGMSQPGDYPYSMVFYAQTIAGFIEKMGLGEVILAGHSMGAQIAMMLSIRYPHQVKKLILIAPAGFEYFSGHEVALMEHTLELGQIWGLDGSYLDTSIRQSFYNENEKAGPIINDLRDIAKKHTLRKWHDMVVASIRSMLREPVEPFLKQIQQPALIIFGEKDAMIPNRLFHFTDSTSGVAYKGAALLAHSELHLIPNAGHFVQLEKSTQVNDLIRQFIP